MADRNRRLKAIAPLMQRLWSERAASEVRAAEERLSGGVPFVERLRVRIELIRGGMTVTEAVAQTQNPHYLGMKSDRELVRSYYSQFSSPFPDARAELLKRLDAIRARQQAAQDLRLPDYE